MPTLIIHTANPGVVNLHTFDTISMETIEKDRTDVSVRRKCRPAGEHKQLLGEKMW